ncbi:nuclear pore complex protein Nup153 isoform X2 [Cephus cinctus]|uniref:Nuclear pore complex protein Nup153 n=1 Tax=Cephus cinctus TaxID=211228 RepID=A0AAJ7BHH2_CEPCN|nr:nuclear pore complex protein Nup153 isoform X2 [Cephus cinctus]
MAKGSKSLTGKRAHGSKPYDANNSFVKKVATKVTDLIPQKSWISKWFNSSQDNGDILNDMENPEESELEEEEMQQPPPLKRACIRMDVTHPPGTFAIRPRNRNSLDKANSGKESFPNHNDTMEDFREPSAAGPSGVRRLVSSTPALNMDIRTAATQRSELNSLASLAMPQNNGATNGTDDNSESSESTSGCSSLIPQTNRQEGPSNTSYNAPYVNRKKFMDDKVNFTNHLQSPRSLFLESTSRDSLSSRRPSFNASMMNSTLDRASSLSSPFYNGNTTFGGANAAGLYRRNRSFFNNSNEPQIKVPRRTSVQVKPSNAAGTDSSGMSQTAKRILEALEHFSSPILDAKKIPLKNTNNINTVATGKKRLREDDNPGTPRVGLRHLTRELTVPTVPDLLKLRRRRKLQDTTVAARDIVSARNGPPAQPASQEYQLRSENDEKSKFHSKVKSKSKTSLEKEETVAAVNLPSIALPISSLPNFDITLPQYPSAAKKNAVKEETFKFASPIKLTETSNNLKSISNFTFSKPLNADEKEMLNDSSNSPSKNVSLESNASTVSCTSSGTMSNFMWTGSSTAPRPKEKSKNKVINSFETKVANELKAGSVMDILGKKTEMETDSKSSPGRSHLEKQTGSLEPSTDFSKSKSHSLNSEKSNLEVHKISQKPTVKPNNNDFGLQFKMSNNLWECDACLVRNKQTDVKCVSCNTPKPGENIERVDSTTKPNTIPSSKSDLMEKFKPAEGSWECPGCMLRNTGKVTTCPCCNTGKPGSLGASPKGTNFTASNFMNNQTSFKTLPSGLNVPPSNTSNAMDKCKPAKGTWECPSCMVRNNDADTSCPCCNTSKPVAAKNGTKKSEKSTSSGFGDNFKKPEGSWTCDACMVPNKGDITECVCCGTVKPGASKPDKVSTTSSTGSTIQFNFGIPANVGSFKFGIDKAEDVPKPENSTSTETFVFCSKPQTTESGQFSFGIPKDAEQATPETSKPAATSFWAPKTTEVTTGFQFNVTKQPAKPQPDPVKEENKVTPLFTFGVPKTEGAAVPAQTPFTFGTPSVTASTVSQFTFGTTKTDITKTEAAQEVPKVTFGTPAAETPKTSAPSSESAPSSIASGNASLPTASAALNKVTETKAVPVFSFGAPSTLAAAINVPTNVTTTAASLPSLGQSPFTFDDKKVTSLPQATSIPSFGQTSVTAPVPASSSTFVFGGNKASEESGAPSKKEAAISFGNATTTPAFNVPSNNSLFGANEAKPIVLAPAFGAPESKPSLFGMLDNKVPAFGNVEAKTPLFGATENKVPTFGSSDKAAPVFSAPAPTFGAPSANVTPFGSTVTPVFGSPAATPSFGTGTPSNIFSTSKPSENNASAPAPSNSSLFTFGSTASPAPSPGGFNFSASNPAAPAQKSLFTFGSTSTTDQPAKAFGSNTFSSPALINSAPSSFAFNAPKPETPAFGQPVNPTPNLFGGPQSTPGLGQNQSAPSFISPNPTPNTGFNFGAAAPTPSTGGFNFGSAASAAPPSGGFNFNAPGAAPVVSFDPNTPPSFKFTGGSAPPTFNAQPTRRIKKAVRRMPR